MDTGVVQVVVLGHRLRRGLPGCDREGAHVFQWRYCKMKNSLWPVCCGCVAHVFVIFLCQMRIRPSNDFVQI